MGVVCPSGIPFGKRSIAWNFPFFFLAERKRFNKRLKLRRNDENEALGQLIF